MAEVPLLAVLGPTATGKSALALALARLVGGQIVNADSMQLYRGMDIGTAKLSAAERQGVPHHLLDVWDVRRTASVADYQRLARDVVEDLRSRGIPPVLVGGSGLYVRSVVDDLDFPGTDPVLRARLEDELVRDGAVALQTRLAVLDPPAAQRIGANGRRLVRALEVIELTGEAWSARLPAYDAIYPTVQLGLDRDNTELDARIAGRVDRMLTDGLVEEVRGLVAAGLRDGVTARQALGYAQCLALLDGDLSHEQARVQTVAATRRFVRRQRSWFRRDPRISWLTGGVSVDDARSAMLSAAPDLVRTIIG